MRAGAQRWQQQERACVGGTAVQAPGSQKEPRMHACLPTCIHACSRHVIALEPADACRTQAVANCAHAHRLCRRSAARSAVDEPAQPGVVWRRRQRARRRGVWPAAPALCSFAQQVGAGGRSVLQPGARSVLQHVRWVPQPRPTGVRWGGLGGRPRAGCAPEAGAGRDLRGSASAGAALVVVPMPVPGGGVPCSPACLPAVSATAS